MSSDYQLEDTIYLPFTTRAFATGIPTALVSGVVDIYENVTATPIVTAETLTVSLNGHAGFNMITVTATAASGFEVGGSYTAILDAGTVDSVSAVGEVVAHFTIDASAAAQDLANGTDGLTALASDIAGVQSDTDNIQTRIPAALVGGAMDCDVSAMQAGSISSGTIAAAELTNIENEIWDALKSAHTTPDSFGDYLDDEITSRSAPATAQTITANQAVDVAQWDGTNVATPTVAGVPEVDITHVEGATTLSELAQGIPAATPSLSACLMLLYMALRNELTTTSSSLTISNNAGTVITKKALTDSGTTYTEAEAVSGP